jgi:hypothetical protein
VYREDGEEYKLVKRIEMKGSIEALTMSKKNDVFIVGVRNDNILHHFDFSSGEILEVSELKHV